MKGLNGHRFGKHETLLHVLSHRRFESDVFSFGQISRKIPLKVDRGLGLAVALVGQAHGLATAADELAHGVW